jgi:ABC-2 type transport system ATP-binding protein
MSSRRTRSELEKLVLGLTLELPPQTVSTEQRMISIPAPDEVNDLAKVAAAVHEVGVEVDEIALRRPTLDDAFMALTGQPLSNDQLSDDQEEFRP